MLTAEEIKKFWEWCGLDVQQGKWRYTNGEAYFTEEQFLHGDDYAYKDDGVWQFLPEVDLNNLFKYAVLKLIEKQANHSIHLDRWANTNYYSARIGMGVTKTDKDPAISLFKAIQEVINGQ